MQPAMARNPSWGQTCRLAALVHCSCQAAPSLWPRATWPVTLAPQAPVVRPPWLPASLLSLIPGPCLGRTFRPTGILGLRRGHVAAEPESGDDQEDAVDDQPDAHHHDEDGQRDRRPDQ